MTLKQRAKLKAAKKALMRDIASKNGLTINLSTYQGAYPTFFQAPPTVHCSALSLKNKVIWICVRDNLTHYFMQHNYSPSIGGNSRIVELKEWLTSNISLYDTQLTNKG